MPEDPGGTSQDALLPMVLTQVPQIPAGRLLHRAGFMLLVSVGGHQGCCLTPYSVQDSPVQEVGPALTSMVLSLRTSDSAGGLHFYMCVCAHLTIDSYDCGRQITLFLQQIHYNETERERERQKDSDRQRDGEEGEGERLRGKKKNRKKWKNLYIKLGVWGTSLVVQWNLLGNAGNMGLIPGEGTKTHMPGSI